MRTDFTGPIAETVPECAQVAKAVFDAMDWRWHDNENSAPTVERIESMFDELLRRCDGQQTSSGRLMVQRRGKRTRLFIEVGEIDERDGTCQECLA